MICRDCYREIPPGGVFCPHCGVRIAAVDTPAAAVHPAEVRDGGSGENPWEDRAGRGPVAAFAETLQQALFHPARFFRGTAPGSSAGPALRYAVVVGTLSIAVFFLWQRALADRLSLDDGGRFFGAVGTWIALAVFLVVVPAVVAFLCLATAAVEHLALALLGGASGTFATTLKAVCYSTSGLAFNVFPLCGALIGGVWQVVLQVIGMRELHRTSTARAFLAWLLPVVLATFLGMLVFFAMIFGLLKMLLEFGEGKFTA